MNLSAALENASLFTLAYWLKSTPVTATLRGDIFSGGMGKDKLDRE